MSHTYCLVYYSCSCVRCISPSAEDLAVIVRFGGTPSSSSCRSTSGRRQQRFFGLSEAAEAEVAAGGLGGSEGGRGDDPLPSSASRAGGGGASGGDVFPAHRMVLSLRSEPMRAMLHSGMKETFATEVLVKDIRPPVFRALLTYLYTDTLQLQKPEDIMELLVVANQYTLDGLVSLCEGFLQGVLDEDNAPTLYHYADALGMPTFEHRVLTIILRHWKRVTRSEGWGKLPDELKERATTFRNKSSHLFMLHKGVKADGLYSVALIKA
ncbi:unnamed protein product [Discosporangium mesarthrocarpum]